MMETAVVVHSEASGLATQECMLRSVCKVGEGSNQQYYITSQFLSTELEASSNYQRKMSI